MSKSLLILAPFVVAATTAFGQAPSLIPFQGQLTDSTGASIDTPAVSMTFKLYSADTEYWSETHPAVAVNDGVFQVLLGSSTPLEAMKLNIPFELGTTVGSDPEMTPRTPLAAVPYARALPGFYTFYHDNGSRTGYNVVGGATLNTVVGGVTGATISGGGGFQHATSFPNRVEQDFGTVSGGFGNTASDYFAAVGGGIHNNASYAATVGGGTSNTAGGNNSTVSGGEQNTASGHVAVVSGGYYGTASGDYAAVVGGQNNYASGNRSAVVGGQYNKASASQASVLGGWHGTSGGESAVTLGGYRNSTSGKHSLAAGTTAHAQHDGTFVWQDATAGVVDTLTTAVANQFVARASGGFWFFTEAAPSVATGVYVAAGSGTWNSLSSRASKSNLSELDPQDYLERLAALDLNEWSYNSEQGVMHVGPMAEDFYAAFGLGPSDKSISTVDADGVALAAIQGLYELVQEQQTEIERMRAVMARAGLE